VSTAGLDQHIEPMMKGGAAGWDSRRATFVGKRLIGG
jgi:hypothetical protein